MTSHKASINPVSHKHATVRVPLVGAETSEFMTVDCIRRSDDSPQRWIASGLGVDPESLEEILTESRDSEEGSLALSKVRISVHPRQFVGKSHGLAVALADKIARYCNDDRQTPPIIATGVIVPNCRGEVGNVDGIEKKVALVREKAEPGSVFIYPAGNQKDAADILRIVEAEKKVRLFPVKHLNELSEFWESRRSDGSSLRHSRSRKVLLQAAAAIAVIAIAGVIGYFSVLGGEDQTNPQSMPTIASPETEGVKKLMPVEYGDAIKVEQTDARKINPARPLP